MKDQFKVNYSPPDVREVLAQNCSGRIGTCPIIQWCYLRGSQIADHNLCRIALKYRAWLVQTDEARAKRVFRFLAYINQSDWRARRLLLLLDNLRVDDAIRAIIVKAEKDFAKSNKDRIKKDKLPLPDADVEALKAILGISPLQLGIVDAADNWVVEVRKDTARAPNGNDMVATARQSTRWAATSR